MGTKERRQREKKDQRQKILDAALEIINKEGFAALSMRKLADRIEYSPASIYLHFASREQIARELSAAGYAQLLDRMTAAAASQNPIERLTSICMAYVTFGLEHPETYQLIFMGDSGYMTAVFAEKTTDSPADRSYQLLLDLAKDLKRAGFDLGRTTANEFAEMLWAAMHGIVSLKLTCPIFPASPAVTLAKVMTRTLINGLHPKKPAAKHRSRVTINARKAHRAVIHADPL
jgi:AcrR family transcriptional regulator